MIDMMGTYILIINIPRSIRIKVGSLGEINFERSLYAYVGSGGKSVLKRLNRHFKSDKKLRWHIDYITSSFRPIMAYIIKEGREDEVAYLLGEKYDYIKGFGASDSRYPSHLFKLGEKHGEMRVIKSVLMKAINEDILEYHL